MTIDLLFPRPVFESIDEEDTCNRTALREACLRIVGKPAAQDAAPDPYYRVASSRADNDQLHHAEPFAALADYINACSEVFLEALGFPGSKGKITQMWANVGSGGDFVYPHNHRDEGFVSGDYVVSCDPRDGMSFHNDSDRQAPVELNPLNYPNFYYQGQEGRLLMYRSETAHSTFPQQGDERIVISFNIQIRPAK